MKESTKMEKVQLMSVSNVRDGSNRTPSLSESPISVDSEISGPREDRKSCVRKFDVMLYLMKILSVEAWGSTLVTGQIPQSTNSKNGRPLINNPLMSMPKLDQTHRCPTCPSVQQRL